jgi:hypothetical protein
MDQFQDHEATPEHLQPENEIIEQCLDWHQEFDRYHWKKISFHNVRHITTCLISARALLDKALYTPDDPLNINQDLDSYNQVAASPHKLSQDDLYLATLIAFACHDLGNIAEDIVLENGKLKIVFQKSGYKAKDAEERSSSMAKTIIGNSKLSTRQKERLTPIVQHLIKQSTFDLDSTALFGRMVRVVDQIGSAVFLPDNTRVPGLLTESLNEGMTVFNPDEYYNFARKRMVELVGDSKDRVNVLAVWQTDLPRLKDVPKSPQNIERWLAEHYPKPQTAEQ